MQIPLKRSASPYKIALTYFILGLLYITLSDKLIEQFAKDPLVLSQIQTYKGSSFILVTSALLYFLIRRDHLKLIKGYQTILEKDKHYRALIKNSNDLIMLMNGQTKLTFATDNVLEELGYTIDEINAKELGEIIHIEDLADVTNQLAAMYICPNKLFIVEFRFRHKAGQWIWIETAMVNHLKDPEINGVVINARNITERKENREQLKKSEEKYMALFNQSPIPMWIIDDESLRFKLSNDAATRQYGFSRQEFLNMSLAEIRPIEDVAEMYEILEATRKSNFSTPGILVRHKKKSGEIITVKIVTSHILFDNRDARLVLGIDVTAEQAAHKQVEESNHLLKAASEIANLGYWNRNFETGEVKWSEELYKIFCIPFDFPLTDEGIGSLFHPDDRPQFDADMSELFRNGGIREFEHRIFTGDGREKWILERLQLATTDYGKPIKLEGIVLDIDARKRSEKAINESNERFEMVMQASLEAIVDWNIVSNEIVWGNGLKQMFGYEPTRKDQDFWAGHIHPEDRESVTKHLAEFIHDKTQRNYYAEYRFRKQDGNYAYVQHRSIFIRNEKGIALRAVGALIDVTESMERLRAIEHQNAALREIAWIQSHVVRAPLATLMGLTELLKNKNEIPMSEEELTDGILLYSKKLDDVIHTIVEKANAISKTYEA